MASTKISWNCLLPHCFNKSKTHISKQVSVQRLSLSDVSNTRSPISVDELSNSLVGANLHIFSLKELRTITRDFSRSNYLGEGGFGVVYKGIVDDGIRSNLKAQVVAVKMLDLDGSQGHTEWLAEVIFLGQLRHPNLVSLVGYCCEDEHRLLVYEFMEGGNLEKHLFGGYDAGLPWLTRIKIALGAAKGLAFLHEEEKPVIFRDFKASNVLLDSNYHAKLSDFGLAVDGPEGSDTHVTARVMGTPGYAAPEYISTGHLTTMSDVYSFGVVLLELLTGLRVVEKNRLIKEHDLVDRTRHVLRDHSELDKVIDPRLEGQYSNDGAKRAASLAYQCLCQNPKSRPRMRSVVNTLESIMESNDIPTATSFVCYANPTCNSTSTINHEKRCENVEEQKVDDSKEKDGRGRRKGRKGRRRIRSSRSRVVFSDTKLYLAYGSNLYCTNVIANAEGD